MQIRTSFIAHAKSHFVHRAGEGFASLATTTAPMNTSGGIAPKKAAEEERHIILYVPIPEGNIHIRMFVT
jgi:hypothetical protein